MNKRETNAERLDRICNRHDPKNEQERELLKASEKPDSQKFLDILASWRTCGSCRNGIPSKKYKGMYRCIPQTVSEMQIIPPDWVCGHWEEKE